MATTIASPSAPLPTSPLDNFETYEEYLDSHITEKDLYYLEDEDVARQLVELGYRGKGYVLSRDEFFARKEKQSQKDSEPTTTDHFIASAHCDLKGSPFLQALADREAAVLSGRLSCIIYIRHLNSRGHEVSGYIDYGHRLKNESFVPYFTAEKNLTPRPNDLSYYNWATQTSTSNGTANFQVIADSEAGLLFKNKRDRKIVNVDPKADPGDSTTRHEIATDEYIQVVLFDHATRRKG